MKRKSITSGAPDYGSQVTKIKEEIKMFALVFGVLFAVSFLGFAITSRIKYSAVSHLFCGVAFIIFTVCFICAFCYTIGTSDLLM